MLTIARRITVLILIMAVTLEAQPNLEPSTKGIVYRLNRKSTTNSTLEATGIIFRENGNLFLITNKHVISPGIGDFGDSLILYLNRKLPNNDILSGPKTISVYFHVDTSNYVFYPSCDSVDLILIALRKENIANDPEDSINSISTTTLISDEVIKAIANTNPIVTVVGYPSKNNILKERTPEYVWGDMVSTDDRLIKFNAPIWAGNSGSPLIARFQGNYFLIGIVCSFSPSGTAAYAIPASNIKSCFQNYFEMTDSRK